MSTSSIALLRNALVNVPDGPVPASMAREIKTLLFDCWNDLPGSSAEGMDADKLGGRIESLEWHDPQLTFHIERHGGTVHGSSRAQLHHWTVDVKDGTAAVAVGASRQLRPRQAPLDVAKMASELVPAIRDHREHPALSWKDAETAELHIGQVIPDEGFSQTVSGRRRRLREALKTRLAAIGWTLDVRGSRTYVKEANPTT